MNYNNPSVAAFAVKESMTAAIAAFAKQVVQDDAVMDEMFIPSIIEGSDWTKSQKKYILREVLDAFKAWKSTKLPQNVKVQSGDRLFDFDIAANGGFTIYIRITGGENRPDWYWSDIFVPPSKEWGHRTNFDWVPEFESEPEEF